MPRTYKNRWGDFKLSELISEALNSTEDKIMELQEIYEYIWQKVPKLAENKNDKNWKVSTFSKFNIQFHKIKSSIYTLKTRRINYIKKLQ